MDTEQTREESVEMNSLKGKQLLLLYSMFCFIRLLLCEDDAINRNENEAKFRNHRLSRSFE